VSDYRRVLQTIAESGVEDVAAVQEFARQALAEPETSYWVEVRLKYLGGAHATPLPWPSNGEQPVYGPFYERELAESALVALVARTDVFDAKIKQMEER